MTTTITGATGIDNIKAATGAVLQVVHGATSTQVDTTSSSYVDTGLTATITPSSTSSNILAIYSPSLYQAVAGSAITIQLVRGSTSIAVHGYALFAASSQVIGLVTGTHLDSPATTSATTYKIQMKIGGSSSLSANYDDSAGDTLSSITLMEIAG
jgi:hypothetical protein